MKTYIFDRYYRGRKCASRTIITKASSLEEALLMAYKMNENDECMFKLLEIKEKP